MIKNKILKNAVHAATSFGIMVAFVVVAIVVSRIFQVSFELSTALLALSCASQSAADKICEAIFD